MRDSLDELLHELVCLLVLPSVFLEDLPVKVVDVLADLGRLLFEIAPQGREHQSQDKLR